MKAVTLAAIREKYPDINPATLQYMGTTVAAAANDAISVHPRYLIVDAGSTNRPMSILVSLDAHGHVMSLSKAMTPSITLAPTMRRPDSTVTNAPKAYVNDIK